VKYLSLLYLKLPLLKFVHGLINDSNLHADLHFIRRATVHLKREQNVFQARVGDVLWEWAMKSTILLRVITYGLVKE
jgi:hypothetical protein